LLLKQHAFSALTLLGGRKHIWPVKNWVVRCWHGYLSGARCLLAYGPADATVSCFSKIQIGFTFLVPATRYTRVALEKGPLNGCVLCVCDMLSVDGDADAAVVARIRIG